MKLIAGYDGVVRSASVKLGKSGAVINRPVNKLYPLLPNVDENDTNRRVPENVRRI